MLVKKHKTNFGLIVVILLAACSYDSDDPQIRMDIEEYADLVLLDGDIATVDSNYGIVSAMAIKDYEILAVGSDDEVRQLINGETKIIELNGRFVMPGFIEGHGHFMSLGRSKQILDLNEVNNWGEIVTKVAIAVDKAKPGEWIFGRGWHQDKWQSVPSDAVDGGTY